MLLEMINKSYGFKVFHHQGLTGYMRIGRNIPSRKVLNALHQLRKKDKVIGFKKGPRWLWRLPNPEESDPSFSQNGDPQIGRRSITSKDSPEGIPDQPAGFTFASDDLEFADSPKENRKSSSKKDEKEKEEEEEEQNYSLAELTKITSPNMGESDDDDDDFEIVFADAEEEE